MSIFKFLSLLFCSLAILSFSFSATSVAFDPLNGACTNPDGNAQKQASTNASCVQASAQGTTDPIAGPNGVINKAANLIAVVAGIGAVVMIVLGAFFYATSAGDSQRAATARSRMLSGIIGLVVIVMAWALIGLVTGKIIR